MHIEQKKWESGVWETRSSGTLPAAPQLVLVFGASNLVQKEEVFTDVKTQYPESHIVMMSTAGEIFDTSVADGTLSLTAIHFEKTQLQFAQTDISESSHSKEAGERVAKALPQDGLKHVMVFSEGNKVNGTALVEGMTTVLPRDVALTGGLVGDGADFKHTYVGLDEAPKEGKIVAIGFYGDISVSYGSMGGWDPFGPERTITKAKDNVLYELDGKPVLDIYREYLGEKAKDLPGSGLLFPLSLTLTDAAGNTTQVVRTILGMNEAEKSLTFAGTMPEGVRAQLMKANFERLISGASDAASMIKEHHAQAELAILISCIGRKLVLKTRIEEETEAIREVFGPKTALAGFYSYGEISPVAPTKNQCELHNQTMTITTFSEA